MGLRDWVTTAAGLALAALGVTAFAVAGGSDPAPSVGADQVGPVVATTTAPVGAGWVPEAPGPEVPGISPAADRVLESGGYADLVDPERLGLPPAVIRVLGRADVVLLIPEEAGP